MSTNLRPLESFSENKEDAPLARELPYWDIMNDIVILSDGTMVAGLKLRGVAIETWDSESINRMVNSFRSTLNSLPDGCEVSFVNDVGTDFSELIERHEKLKGDDPLISWIANHRIQALKFESDNFELLKPSLYAFVYRRFSPQGEGVSQSIFKSFFTPVKKFLEVKEKEHEVAERDLRQSTSLLSERLESCGLAAKSLDGNEVLNLMYGFLNPVRVLKFGTPKINQEHRDQEFTAEEIKKVPQLSTPSLREQLCFSDLIQGEDNFKLDGVFHRVLTIKTLPEFTHSALISKLSELPFPHTVHVHIQVPEQSKELSSLQAKRRMAHSMSMTQGGRASDLESEAKLQSTEELLRELINTGQKIFYFQTSILLRSENKDDLDTRTKTVLSTIRELNGAEGLAETVAGFKLWKTMLPFGTTNVVRSKRIKTDNLADFLPLYEPYSGTPAEQKKPVCLFRNRASGLVAYDPFDGLSRTNFNSLVTGSSGAGKSFLNNLVLLQYMTQKPMVYVIDIGGSYKKLCEFLGGTYIEITPPRNGEKARTINPFQLPPGQSEPSPQKIKFLLALLENVLTDTDGDRLPKLDKSMLEETVLTLYKNLNGRSPKFSDLAEMLSSSRDERLRQFARMLYPWTGDRPYGRLLDGENKLTLDTDVVVFDLKGLSSYPDLQSVMILIITDFILGRVESKDPAIQARRKQILMDECWDLLKGPASSFMEYCVRTLRKTGSGITFITQGLEEIVASPIGSAILSNTATKFILIQKGDLEPIRKILKLNDQEMALISSLRQAKGKYSEAFLMANDYRTVIRARPTPTEYWLATSDASDNALLTHVRETYPEKTLADAIHFLSQHFPTGSQGMTRLPQNLLKGVA